MAMNTELIRAVAADDAAALETYMRNNSKKAPSNEELMCAAQIAGTNGVTNVLPCLLGVWSVSHIELFSTVLLESHPTAVDKFLNLTSQVRDRPRFSAWLHSHVLRNALVCALTANNLQAAITMHNKWMQRDIVQPVGPEEHSGHWGAASFGFCMFPEGYDPYSRMLVDVAVTVLSQPARPLAHVVHWLDSKMDDSVWWQVSEAMYSKMLKNPIIHARWAGPDPDRMMFLVKHLRRFPDKVVSSFCVHLIVKDMYPEIAAAAAGVYIYYDEYAIMCIASRELLVIALQKGAFGTSVLTRDSLDVCMQLLHALTLPNCRLFMQPEVRELQKIFVGSGGANPQACIDLLRGVIAGRTQSARLCAPLPVKAAWITLLMVRVRLNNSANPDESKRERGAVVLPFLATELWLLIIDAVLERERPVRSMEQRRRRNCTRAV